MQKYFGLLFARLSLWSVILTVVCGLLRKYKIVPILTYVGLVVVLGMRIVDANIQFGSFFNTTVSDFYEREYVFPENTKITFKNKRNVLMIALESMEKSYADENLFGAGGLTPHITKMERDNVGSKLINQKKTSDKLLEKYKDEVEEAKKFKKD